MISSKMIITVLLISFFYLLNCRASNDKNNYNKNDDKGEISIICSKAIELNNNADLDSLIHLSSGSRLVLLGESSHGTAEFYHWRAEISKRLIEEEGFNFIAVEGDWTPLYRLNLYVKGYDTESKSANEILRTFSRWPEWMWGNTIIADLAEWLKEYNSTKSADDRVGFYGMDVYGQWEAMDEVLRVAEKLLPERVKEIEGLYSCFTAYDKDEWKYAQAVLQGKASCEDNLRRVVNIFKEALNITEDPGVYNKLLHGKQSALVVQNAEDFYRLAVRSNTTSWNSRVMHMHETVNRLLGQYGNDSRGIVWAHNTHVGDARATSMQRDGRFNIGQLSRQTRTDEKITIVGFSTYTGRVNAGSRWGAPMSIMRIPEARSRSVEELLNECGMKSFYSIFDEEVKNDPGLQSPLGHRAIGVVYDPSVEHLHNYVPTILTKRYDAIIFLHTTSSLEVVK